MAGDEEGGNHGNAVFRIARALLRKCVYGINLPDEFISCACGLAVGGVDDIVSSRPPQPVVYCPLLLGRHGVVFRMSAVISCSESCRRTQPASRARPCACLGVGRFGEVRSPLAIQRKLESRRATANCEETRCHGHSSSFRAYSPPRFPAVYEQPRRMWAPVLTLSIRSCRKRTIDCYRFKQMRIGVF